MGRRKNNTDRPVSVYPIQVLRIGSGTFDSFGSDDFIDSPELMSDGSVSRADRLIDAMTKTVRE